MRLITIFLASTIFFAASAQTFTFSKVMDWSNLAGTVATGLNVSESGHVAFSVRISTIRPDGPPYLSYEWKSFVYEGGALRPIGDPNQFTSISDISANGAIVYAERKPDGSTRLLVDQGGTVTEVADTDAGEFSAFNGASVNDGGDVVFFAIKDSGKVGVFRRSSSGEITTVAEDPNIPIPTLNIATQPRINNKGTVAMVFGAYGGFYLSVDGELKAIPIGLDIVPYVREYGVVINEADTIAFATPSPSGQDYTIYRSVAGAEAEPVLTRSSFDLWAVTMNNSGKIAFVEQVLSTEPPTIGLVSVLTLLNVDSQTPIKVIQTGEQLFGSTVTAIQYLDRTAAHRYMNNEGVIAFQYALADGTGGIAFASPVQ